MDSDQWISRLLAAKRQYSIQNHQSLVSDRLSVDGFELVEEEQPDLCCPYCYEDYDIVSLCSHLEEDHPFESKGAVCPVCSANVAKDMLNHIVVQHGQLFKAQRRRMFRKFGTSNNQAFALLGRDLRDARLQALLGNRSNHTNVSTAPDPLLSSLLLNLPTSEAEDPAKTSISNVEKSSIETESPLPHWKSSLDSSLSLEEQEERRKLVTSRANFVQEIVLSAMFGDS